MPKPMPYTMTPVMTEAAQEDRGAAMAFFLQENAGSILGRWHGYLPAAVQRTLFGKFLGKGRIRIDGDTEEVTMTVSVAFGTDWDVRFRSTWASLAYPA